MKPFDFEIRRKIGAGSYRTYAAGYWRPFSLVVHAAKASYYFGAARKRVGERRIRWVG